MEGAFGLGDDLLRKWVKLLPGFKYELENAVREHVRS